MRSSFTPLSNDLRVQTLRNLILNNLVIRHETGPKDKTTIEFPKLGGNCSADSADDQEAEIYIRREE
jgi:hypothetical protein